jgi:hypothetical protein
MTLKSAVPCVKAPSRSSTVHPQEKEIPFSPVMPGLVPGIHVLAPQQEDVDGRVKPGHDEENQCPPELFFIAASCSGLALPWKLDFQVS